MKKKISFIMAAAMLAFVCLVCSGCQSNPLPTDKDAGSTSSIVTTSAKSAENSQSETTVKPQVVTTQQSSNSTTKDVAASQQFSMKDALFIGDSRTVGLKEYSKLDADFFANVGMSVYSINKTTVSMGNLGKVSLQQLLAKKQYGKIYIMLGINEVGSNLKTTIGKYSDLVNLIKSKQPNALLFLEANLHVTKKKCDMHLNVNNTSLNRLNDEISKLADDKTVFYLNVNDYFDDENGNLPENMTSDNVHLYAKYYPKWADWITSQSAGYAYSK